MHIDRSGVELRPRPDYSGPNGCRCIGDSSDGVHEMCGFDLGRRLNVGRVIPFQIHANGY